MFGVGRESFQRVTEDVDTVAGREIQFQFVGLLQELDGEVQHLGVGERQVVLEYGEFVFAGGVVENQGGLEAAEDIVGDLEGRFVLIHRSRHSGSHRVPGW